MTAPADALRVVMELVAAVEAEYCDDTTESMEPDDSPVSYPEEKCNITFGHIRLAKRATEAIAQALADARRWRFYVGAMIADDGTARAAIQRQNFPAHSHEAWNACIDSAIAATEAAHD